jgi:hypothetical protein
MLLALPLLAGGLLVACASSRSVAGWAQSAAAGAAVLAR